MVQQKTEPMLGPKKECGYDTNVYSTANQPLCVHVGGGTWSARSWGTDVMFVSKSRLEYKHQRSVLAQAQLE